MQSDNQLRISDDGIIFEFTPKNPDLAVVLGACHDLLDVVYAKIDKDESSGAFRAILQAKETVDRQAMETIARRFESALKTQKIRQKLFHKTRRSRDALITQALLTGDTAAQSQSQVAFPDRPEPATDTPDMEGIEALEGLDDEDFLDDPLEIAVPWEEKYGKAEMEDADESDAAPEKDKS